jgi:hypothetical protein
MHRYPERAGRVRPGMRIALLSGLLAMELAIAAPAADAGRGGEALDLQAVVSEFQQICGELEQARLRLGAGALSDEEFADRILDLFVQADSLQHLLPRLGWVTKSDVATSTFALSRALRYLVESLRENYVGIAAKNGAKFVEADRAYRAAVAWRPAAKAAGASAALYR